VNAGLDESDPVAAPIVVVFVRFQKVDNDIFPRCEDDQVEVWLVCRRV
jgi:hypothetical protein